MFTKILTLATTGLLVFTSVKATPRPDADSTFTNGLEVSCKLTDDGNRISDYSIIIYQDGNAIDTLSIELARAIYIPLAYNHNYALRHIKKGYRDRIVLIDTHIGQKIYSEIMEFDYEIELVREDEPANTFDDFPVALIHYDQLEQKFDYSRKYDRQVRHRYNDYVITKN